MCNFGYIPKTATMTIFCMNLGYVDSEKFLTYM